MNKTQALASILNYFNGDNAATADALSDAYTDEPMPELADALNVITSELEDETELHEWLNTLPKNKIGNLADVFADTFELCYTHSSDPEVCGCEV